MRTACALLIWGDKIWSPKILKWFLSNAYLIACFTFSPMVCRLIPCPRRRVQIFWQSFGLQHWYKFPRLTILMVAQENVSSQIFQLKQWGQSSFEYERSVILCRDLSRGCKVLASNLQAGTSTTAANSTACSSFWGQHCLNYDTLI